MRRVTKKEARHMFGSRRHQGKCRSLLQEHPHMLAEDWTAWSFEALRARRSGSVGAAWFLEELLPHLDESGYEGSNLFGRRASLHWSTWQIARISGFLLWARQGKLVWNQAGRVATSDHESACDRVLAGEDQDLVWSLNWHEWDNESMKQIICVSREDTVLRISASF